MSEKNVVREDVVSLAFELDDSGIKELNKIIKDLQKVIKDALGGVDDVSKDVTKEIDNIADSTKDAVKEFEKGFDNATKAIKDTGQEASKFTKELDKSTESVSKELKNKITNGVKNVKNSFSSLESKVVNTASKFKNFVNTKFDKLISGLSRFNKKADESTEKVQKLADESGGIGSGIKGTIAKAAGAFAIGAASKSVIDTGMSFEAGMSTVKAVSGADDAEIAKLTAKAKEMGATTMFSASESAEALNYMAMAGWKTEQMIGGIEGIMNLAAASGEDLGTTSDIVTDALTAFGMEASESGKFADVLAVASSNANTNVSMMGETFKYVAASAGAMGYKCEDIGVAIGLMANAGIKGSQSGTALNSVIKRLAKPTKESAMAISKLGLSLKDEKGNMKSFQNIMVDMRKGFKNLEADEKASYAAMLAGGPAMSGLLSIVNASDEDFDKLTEAINNSTGAAKEMADIKNDNLLGQLTLLKSGIEGFMIDIYDVIKTPLKGSVKWISTSFLPKIVSGFSKLVKIISPIFEKLSPVFGGFINGLSKKFEWFKTNILPSLIQGFNTIKNAVLPIIQTIITKFTGLFDRIFGLVMQNKNTILDAFNSICGLFTYFSESILPELVNAFNWIIQSIMPIFSDIIKAGSELVQAVLPFIKDVVDSIISVIKGISPVIKGIMSVVKSTIKTISKNMQTIIPVLKKVAVGYIAIKSAMLAFKAVSIATNIVLKAQEIWLKAVSAAETVYIIALYAMEAATKAFNMVVNASPLGKFIMLISAVITVGTALYKFFDNSSEKVKKMGENLEKTASKVTSFKDTWNSIKVTPVDFDKLISSKGNSISSIDSKINKFEGEITKILQSRFSEQQALRDENIANIKKYQKDIKKLEEEKLGIYRQSMKSQSMAIDSLKFNDIKDVSKGAKYLENAKQGFENANDSVGIARSSKMAEIDNIYQGNATIKIDGKTLEQARDEANKAFDLQIFENQKEFDNIISKFQSGAIKAVRKSINSWKNLSDGVENNFGESSYGKVLEKYNEKLSKINKQELEEANVFIGTMAKIKENGYELDLASRDAVENFLGPFKNIQDKQMDEIGKRTLLGMIKGIEDQIPGLADVANMSCENIVDTIESYLEIGEYSRVTESEGKKTILGYNNGVESTVPTVLSTTKALADGFTAAFNALDLYNSGTKIINSLVRGFNDSKDKVKSAAEIVSFAAKKAFSGLSLYDVGSNIVDGLVRGIRDSNHKVESAAQLVALTANLATKKPLEIHSPSRVMRYNGQMVGEGLILGIMDKIPDVQKSSEDMSDSVIMGYTPENSPVYKTSNSNHTENNNISPNIYVTVYGGDEKTAEQIKESIEDIFERMFESYHRKKPRMTEV